MITGMSMVHETCRFRGQVSHNLLYWKKTLWLIYVVLAWDLGGTAYIQARSFMTRYLEDNGKRSAEGKQKLVEWEAPSG